MNKNRSKFEEKIFMSHQIYFQDFSDANKIVSYRKVSKKTSISMNVMLNMNIFRSKVWALATAHAF